jgi:hypothetical protein
MRQVYGSFGQGLQISQHTIGGAVEHTITQQQRAASTLLEEVIVKPPRKIARNANNSTSAFIFFIEFHLLSKQFGLIDQ